ncbi:MAG: HipA N-terminal domain-containing protein [Proteobacteria bacterium]|nr:HipA N-terminal domain-containing protein [Pseudomonadota bacterium]MBU1584856.1 HipA N-terminal domain-containing protein [Pseudomonadota bacterium]MBU2628770.1 HipA N-terminal domain-containing protein [Pseudomonadota bacterium]
MDRVGRVFFNNFFAGILKQTDQGYMFTYDPDYLAFGTPLSFHLPLQKQAFKGKQLFPFFENLAAEGWLKNMQCTTQKIDKNDVLELILENGKDMAGAVTILKGQQ